jgi:hypothetical protein
MARPRPAERFPSGHRRRARRPRAGREAAGRRCKLAAYFESESASAEPGEDAAGRAGEGGG